MMESPKLSKLIKHRLSSSPSLPTTRTLYDKLYFVVELSTPYVHTPIGLVERNIQTVENYVETFMVKKLPKSGPTASRKDANIFMEFEH